MWEKVKNKNPALNLKSLFNNRKYQEEVSYTSPVTRRQLKAKGKYWREIGIYRYFMGFPGGAVEKNPPAKQERQKTPG